MLGLIIAFFSFLGFVLLSLVPSFSKQKRDHHKIKNNSGNNEKSSNKNQKFKNPFIQKTFDELKHLAPAFPVKANDIKIICNPDEFFKNIIEGIKRSKNRVVLASLYLGIGDHEKELVKALDEFCSKDKNRKVTLLFDFMRGTRGTNVNASSVSMVSKLVKSYPNQVKLYLYHTPMHHFLKRVLTEKYNETIGVQHVKAYVFDNDVVMSGANLSDWYFVDRQDRYMVIRNSVQLAQFLSDLISIMGSFCFKYNPDGTLEPNGNIKKYHPINDMKGFRKLVEEEISKLMDNAAHEKYASLLNKNELNSDTYIFPTIQFGPYNIVQDEDITCAILRLAGSTEHAKLSLSSAYFNFTPEYERIILDTETEVDIITAAPKANGFFTAAGLMRHIPTAYSLIEQKFFNKICGRGKENLIKLWEYYREKWTFHAKGLWIYPSPLPNQDPNSLNSDNQSPFLTMIGSPNFGHRSVAKDTECQIVILTENEKLRSELKKERDYLYNGTEIVTDKTFQDKNRSKANFTLKLTTNIIKTHL